MKRLLSPDPADGSTPTPPNAGEIIGQDIKAVSDVIAPFVGLLPPPYATGVSLAFKLLSVAEPAAYNAIAALFEKGDLTPDQQAEIARVDKALDDPDSYLA